MEQSSYSESEPDMPVVIKPVTRAQTAETLAEKASESRPTESGTVEKPMAVDDVKKLLAPRTTHYEFMGPIGVFFMLLGLPTTVYYLYFACNAASCSVRDVGNVEFPEWRGFVSLEAFCLFLGWFVLQCFLYVLPVGKVSCLY